MGRLRRMAVVRVSASARSMKTRSIRDVKAQVSSRRAFLGVAGGMAIALTDKMAPAYAKSGVETQRTPWAFPERGGNTAIFMNQQYDEYYKLLELTKSAGTKTEVPAPEPEPKAKETIIITSLAFPLQDRRVHFHSHSLPGIFFVCFFALFTS